MTKRLDADRPPSRVAGLAAGLAAGTKLSFLAPVIALFVGLTVIAGGRAPSHRRLVRAPRASSPAATGSSATLVAVGNPIPFTTFGPLDLPSARAGVRAAARVLGLPLRDRLRRLGGLVLPRARRLVRLPLAAGPRGLRRRRRLRALARRRAAGARARRRRPVHRARLRVHPADRGRGGGAADRLRVERPLHRARRPRSGSRCCPACRRPPHRARPPAHARRPRDPVRRHRRLAGAMAAGPRQGRDRRRGRGARRLRRGPLAARPRPLGSAAPARLGRRARGGGRDRRARRRLVGAAPLPRAPLREPEPAAEARRRRALGARPARTRRSRSAASAASSTSTRSTAPTSRTRSSGSASRAPTAPTSGSRPAPSGARRSPTAATRTSSPPTTRSAPASSPTPRRRCGRARTRPPSEILRDGPVSVFELDGAARPRRLRRPPRPQPGRAQRRLGQRRADRQPALSGRR